MNLRRHAALSDHWSVTIHINRCPTISDDEFQIILDILKKEGRLIPLKSLIEHNEVENPQLKALLGRISSTTSSPFRVEFISHKKDTDDICSKHSKHLDSYQLFRRISCSMVFSKAPGRYETLQSHFEYKEEEEETFLTENDHTTLRISQHISISESAIEEALELRSAIQSSVRRTALEALLPSICRKFIVFLVTRLLGCLYKMLSLNPTNPSTSSTISIGSTSSLSLTYYYKILGDFYLFLGNPICALEFFYEARNAARRTNDTLCMACCYESEAAGMYLYCWTMKRNRSQLDESPVTSCDTLEDESTSNRKKIPDQTSPAIIERLLHDSSKRWMLGSSATTLQYENLLENLYLKNSFPKSCSAFSTDADIDEKLWFFTPMAQKLGLLNIQFILSRLRFSVSLYKKLDETYDLLLIEVLFRLARLLRDTFYTSVPCLCVLSMAVGNAAALDIETREAMFFSAAIIAFSAGGWRHGTLFLFTALQLQVQRRVTRMSLYHILFLCRVLFFGDLVFPDPGSNPTTCGLFFLSSSFNWTPYLQTLFCETKFLKKYCEVLQSNQRSIELDIFGISGKNFKTGYTNASQPPFYTWPATRLILLKTLNLICLKLNIWECALYAVYALLCHCHSILGSQAQNTALHLIWCITQKQNGATRLPAVFVCCPREKKRNEGSKIHLTSKFTNDSPDSLALKSDQEIKSSITLSGGLFQYSNQVFPVLYHMSVHGQLRGSWLEEKNGHKALRCILDKNDLKKRAKDPSSFFSSDPPTPLSNCAIDFKKEKRSSQISPLQCVVGESMELMLVVDLSLGIPLSIDSIEILALGAQFKTHSKEITLNPQRVNHVIVNVTPLSAEVFWIVGVIFKFSGLEVPQLCVMGDPETFASYHSLTQLDLSHGDHTLLKSGSLISGRVFPCLPYLSYHLILPRSSPLEFLDTAVSTDAEDSLHASGSKMSCDSHSSFLSELTLYLGNESSDQCIEDFSITLVQDPHMELESFLQKLSDPCAVQKDSIVSPVHVTEISRGIHSEFIHLNFSEAMETTSGYKALAEAWCLDTFQDTPPVTWRHSMIKNQESLALRLNIRYTGEGATRYLRFLCVPLSVVYIESPPLYVLPESLHLTHYHPLPLSQLIYCVIHSHQYSTNVEDYFRFLLQKEENFRSILFLNQNIYALNFLVANTSTNAIECYIPRFHWTNGQDCSGQTNPFVDCVVCPPLAEKQCTLYFLYEYNHDIKTFPLFQKTHVDSNLGCLLDPDNKCHLIRKALEALRYKEKRGHLLCVSLRLPHLTNTSYSSVKQAVECFNVRLDQACQDINILLYPLSCHWSVGDGLTNQVFRVDPNEPLYVPCFTPLKITVTLTRHSQDITNLHTHHHQVSSLKSSLNLHCMLIPFEFLYMKSGREENQQERNVREQPSNALSDSQEFLNGCIWTGSLETSVQLHTSCTVTFTLFMTAVGIKQTLYFGCLCRDPLMFLFQNSCISLISKEK